MSREAVIIDGTSYRLLHKDLVPHGGQQWQRTRRPSTPGDPAVPTNAQWQVWGSNLMSFEDTSAAPQGYLGVDYTVNGDTRWEGMATVGPKITTVTLSANDGTATPTTALNMAVAWTDDTTTAYAYIIRGTPFAKIKLSDMSAVNPGQQLANAATDVLFSLNASGNGEVSFAMGNTNLYSVIQSVTTGSDAANYSTPATGIKVDIFGQAPDRVVALSGSNTTNGALTLSGNVVLGTTDMKTPAWNTIATVQAERIQATGFALMSNYYVLGTSLGPYLLDTTVGRFFPLIPEIDNDPENCRQMTVWTFIGVVVPLKSGVRYQHWSQGVSWGTKRFYQNTSPVSGIASAHSGSTDWLYQAVKNESTGDTYLLAWRPRLQTDPHPNPLTPYVIGKLGAHDCKFLNYIGTVSGQRTSRTLMGGYGTDAFYITIGDTDREVDDSSYLFNSAGGTIYLTEMRRAPEMIKDLVAVQFTTANLNTGDSVQMQFSIDGGTANVLNGSLLDASLNSVNGKVTTNGFQRQLFVDDGGQPLTWANGRRIKPEIVLTNAATTSAPQVIGLVTLEYQLRPVMTTVYQFTVVLDDSYATRDENEAEAALLAEWGRGPVRVDEDPDGNSFYVNIESVSVQRIAETGGPTIRPGAGNIAIAQVVAARWPSEAGD